MDTTLTGIVESYDKEALLKTTPKTIFGRKLSEYLAREMQSDTKEALIPSQEDSF
jgi:hypothetical protein